MRTLAVFLRRDFANDLAYRLSFALELADAVILLVAVFMLSRGFLSAQPGGYDAFAFVATGLAVNGAVGVCLGCYALAVRGARDRGTFRTLLVAPMPPSVQVLASGLYPMLRGIVDAAMHLGAAAMLGVSLGRANVAGAALVFLLTLVAASAVGILSAAFAMVFRRGDPLLWLIGVIGFVFGGVFYPADRLPDMLKAISWLTPVAPALAAMRPLLLDGAALSSVWPAVTGLALFAAAGLPLSLWCFNLSVTHARRTGAIKEA